MIDFNKFSILSVMGKEAGKQTENEYPKTVLTKYDKFLEDIKKFKAEMEINKKQRDEREL